MFTRAALLASFVVLTALPALADIQIRNPVADARNAARTTGSSLSYGCATDGSPTLELNSGDDEQFFYVSLRGKSVNNLRDGVIKSYSVSGDENGMGMICKPPGGQENCKEMALQVRITSTFVKPGEMLEGTISGGGKSADFQVTMPTTPQSCN